MDRVLYCCFNYYSSNFNYAFYTLGLNIWGKFNSKSCPIPYALEVEKCPPVIGFQVYYMYTPL